MKGSVFLLLIIFLGVLLFHFDQDNRKDLSNYEVQDSELALLMRFVHDQAKSLKGEVVNAQALPDYNKEIEFITSANPTRPSVQGPEFEAFARYYIEKNKNVFEAPGKDSYNDMIESCVACHNEFCPGPVRTIKKLTIK